MYSSWYKNLVVKVAMDTDGVARVVKRLHDERIKSNMTVMTSFNQLLLVAKAGTNFASLSFNRASDIGSDPARTIREVVPLLERDDESRLIMGVSGVLKMWKKLCPWAHTSQRWHRR